MISEIAKRPLLRARARATDAVQWTPARMTLKRGAHHAARIRAGMLQATGRLPEVANIYTASSPKAGSQWAKALFDHPIVQAHTGLFTLPQLGYERRGDRPFPLGTFVPGIYVSYDKYQQILKTRPYRTVYIFRDPRDLVVSGYFSAIQTHRTMAKFEHQREELRAMPLDQALLYSIELMAGRLRDIESWVDANDANVALFRLEDISSEPDTQVARILGHCGVVLSAEELATVLRDTSRESLQRKDLARRTPGSESHYRVRRQGFRELFSAQHYETIETIVPGLIARLNYPGSDELGDAGVTAPEVPRQGPPFPDDGRGAT